MKRPLFSCVIPVKGPRPYFDEALRSLLSQGMGDNLEIIVQDADVRSGGVGELNHEIHERHENGRGVRGQELAVNDGGLEGVRWFCEADKGQSDALNKGFAKAKGDWFFWLNADDVLLPGALKKVKAIIHSTTATSDYNFFSWIVGNQVCVDEQGRVLKCMQANRWHDGLYRHAVPHVNGPSAFFRRELFEKVGGFDTSLHICMDWDLWIRFMKAGAQFHRIDEYMWAMRQWAGSKTQGDSCAADWHGKEVGRMLAKNRFVVTRRGIFKLRLWRLMDGSYLRGWVDTLRMRGRTL